MLLFIYITFRSFIFTQFSHVRENTYIILLGHGWVVRLVVVCAQERNYASVMRQIAKQKENRNRKNSFSYIGKLKKKNYLGRHMKSDK